MKESLCPGLKKMVLHVCNVPGVQTTAIRDDEPVIGGNGALQLDSLDAVEIVVAIERHFGIKFENAGASRKIFGSFSIMADYILEHAPRERIQAFISSI